VGFGLFDVPYKILLMPQDIIWGGWSKNEHKSLWGGLIMNSEKAQYLPKKELLDEIIKQLIESSGFQDEIYSNNGFYLTRDKISHADIWKEWNWNGEMQVSDSKRWVNTHNNKAHRPDQSTNYSNLFIGGSHTKTSTDYWLMEGAVESGKLVANNILKHDGLKPVKIFQKNYTNFLADLDTMLYPHIHILEFILLIILIIILAMRNYRKKKVSQN